MRDKTRTIVESRFSCKAKLLLSKTASPKVQNPCDLGEEGIITRFDLPNNSQNTFDTLADEANNVGLKPRVQYVSGTGDNDTITVTATSASEITVTVAPEFPFEPSQDFFIDRNDADKVIIYSGWGNDTVNIDSDLGFEFIVRGGPGADALNASTSNDRVILSGGSGNDVLEGGLGADELHGGEGNDHYTVSGPASATDPRDKIIDSLIRDTEGIGDLAADGGGVDDNDLEFSSAGFADIEFSFDLGTNRTVSFMVEGDPQYPWTMVGSLMLRAVDDLFAAVGTNEAQWDFDGDGIVESDDDDSTTDTYQFIVVALGTQFGDANLDGAVDAQDFDELGNNWLQTFLFTSWGLADFNGDGVVDALDMDMLGGNWLFANGNQP